MQTSTATAQGHLDQVAVVVVTYNSERDLPGLLDSLGPGLEGVGWELVVVDNASHDDSVEVVRRSMPTARVVEMPCNAGYAAAVNAGVAAAGSHTSILVLNADVRLDPGCAATLATVVRASGTGIAVPRLLDARGAVIESQRREPTIARTLLAALIGARRAGRVGRWAEVISAPSAYEQDAVTDWAEGSTQLISRQCWDECGPWDESYFLYSEETEFGLRARDHGFSTRYVASAGATHLEGGSAQSVRLHPLVVANQVRLYRSRHSRAATAVFWAACLAREVSRAAVGQPWARAAVRVLLDPRRLRAARGPQWLR